MCPPGVIAGRTPHAPQARSIDASNGVRRRRSASSLTWHLSRGRSGKSRSGVPGDPSGLGMSTAADHDLHLMEMIAPRHRSSYLGAGERARDRRAPHEAVELAAYRQVEVHDERLEAELGGVRGDVVFVTRARTDEEDEVAVSRDAYLLHRQDERGSHWRGQLCTRVAAARVPCGCAR